MNWLELIAYWLVSGIALALTAAIVPGFKIRGFGTAVMAAIVIGIANIFLRPILVFFSIPFYILTLGLFTFVVDAIILRLCAAVFEDFEISGWISALLGAVILSFTSMFLHWMFI